MDEPVIAFEAGRMWLGEQPPLFFLEILFRSVLAYAWCFTLIRLLSGKAVAQMSMTDFVLVIALGSAVGDMAFYADVPILHALLAVTVIIIVTKLLDRLMHDSDLAKRLLDNAPVTLVHEGVIDVASAARRDIGTLEVMERLRLNGIRNLGEVEWAFLEADGGTSVFRHARARPGLSIVPPFDLAPRPPAMRDAPPGQARCCRECGHVHPAGGPPPPHCPNCGCGNWVAAENPEGA